MSKPRFIDTQDPRYQTAPNSEKQIKILENMAYNLAMLIQTLQSPPKSK